jgi:uncharacterized protein
MAHGDDEIGFSPGSSIAVPVFPLPSLVLFPQVLQALYIFEPRYRAMVRDLKRWNDVFAVALLKEGWEQDYEGRPPYYSTVCLCRLVKSQRRADGTFDVLVAGTSRAQVVSEVAESAPYRVAIVQPFAEIGVATSAASRGHLGRKLLSCCDRRLAGSSSGASPIGDWMRKSLPLQVLTDLLAYSLPLDVTCKQQLLSERDVRRRAQRLISLLEAGNSESSADELVGAANLQINYN